MKNRPPTVMIINTSPDVVDMLRAVLERAGIVVVSAMTHEIREGAVDLDRFVVQHAPKVVIYDIAPPYDANWQLFLHIRRMPAMKDRYFILTSTNATQVRKLSGLDREIYEVVGRPLDLDAIVQATREALKARPTR
jgi:CheY-like chemotaxis protein